MSRFFDIDVESATPESVIDVSSTSVLSLVQARAELATLERRVLARESTLRDIARQLGRSRFGLTEALALHAVKADGANVEIDNCILVRRLTELTKFALHRCGLDVDGADRIISLALSIQDPLRSTLDCANDFSKDFDDEFARQSARNAGSAQLEMHARAAVLAASSGVRENAGLLHALRAEPDDSYDGQGDGGLNASGCGSDGFSLLSLVTSSSGSDFGTAPISLTASAVVAPLPVWAPLIAVSPPLILSAKEIDDLKCILGPRSQALVLAQMSRELPPDTTLNPSRLERR